MPGESPLLDAVSSGVYVRVRGSASAAPRAGVFLDRDGVVVEEVGYLSRLADIRPIPGSFEAIAALNRAGIPVALTTNQSGVGRGLYGWETFESIQQAMEAELAKKGGWFDAVLACAFHKDAHGPYRGDHACRKPQPGMLLHAAERLNLTLSASWMIGDKVSDLDAASAAGLEGAILVSTGYGVEQRAELERRSQVWPGISFAADLDAAVRSILLNRR